MLTKDQKKQLVKDLVRDIDVSKSVVFVDYRGLKVKDFTQLKRELRASDVKLRVFKKTLIQKALEDLGIESNIKKMEGQLALAFSADEIAGAKIINKFGKTNENLKILAGILEKKIVEAAKIKALAGLPGREELLAKMVGTLSAPLTGFINILNGNMRSLVQVLKRINEIKS